MKLIITRHGETEENLNKIWQGNSPGKLTEKGIEQAKKLAYRLGDEKIDLIISSDLTRASDTTKEIVYFHKDVPVYFTKDLRERFYGDLQGKEKRQNLKILLDDEKFCEKNRVESMGCLYSRAERLMDKILKEYSHETILFVAHSGINRMIIKYLRKIDAEDKTKIPQGNTAVTIFEISEGNVKEILFNCTKHLEDLI